MPSKSRLSFPILFTLIVLLSYGITLSWFSFYGDDWIFIYNYHIAGSQSFINFTAWDRPFSAWIYILSSALFGEHVLPYHLLLLVQRWLSVWLFWRVLVHVWGERNGLVTAAVLLFAAYPGFQQQPIAVQYIMHFASLDLVLFSLLCMMKAFQCWQLKKSKSRWLLWTVSGVFSSALAHFTCEYFIGLEFIRPLLLLFSPIFAQPEGEKSVRHKLSLIFTQWLPYILSTAAFLIWRVFIFSFQTYQPKFLDEFSTAPLTAISKLFQKIISDLITVFYRAYRHTLDLPASADRPIWLVLFCLSALLCCFFFFYTRNATQSGNKPTSQNHADLQVFLTGLLAVLAAGIPFWTTFIDVNISYPWDRSTISFSAGVALILAAMISMLFKKTPQWIVLSLLVGLSVASHFSDAVIYRNEAAKMNDYFWQLAWRMPGLEKGTILVSDDIPLNRYSDNDLTPVVNWQYAPELTGNIYQYKYFDLDLREQIYYSDPSQVIPVEHTYRSHQFYSSTEKTLGIYYREKGCLQTIDASQKSYPGLPDSLQHLSDLSNIEVILPDPDKSAVPPAPIGSEPQHGYCYYFQKINLALQQNHYAEAASLANEALDKGLSPDNPADWAPTAAALLKENQIGKAEGLIVDIDADPQNKIYFCSYLQNGSFGTFPDQAIKRMRADNCNL